MVQQEEKKDWQIIDSHVAVGEEHYLRLSQGELLARMDRCRIGIAVARPMGAEVAVDNRRGNERVLGAPPRVRGLATASPWYGKAALEELERCRGRGAVGLYLHPTRQGFMPTDPIARPLAEYARSVGWPVVFHTGTYIQSDVLAVAEVARRFRGVMFVCDNAGFSDMWFELPGMLAEVPNLMLCSSLIWPRAIGNTVKNFGSGRILFGSGEPRDSMEAALVRMDRLELSEADRQAILHDNAMRVFKL